MRNRNTQPSPSPYLEPAARLPSPVRRDVRRKEDDMSNTPSFFTGRIGRIQFLARYAPLVALHAWLFHAFIMKNTLYYFNDLHLPTLSLVIVVLTVCIADTLVKRFHDIDQSGLSYFLLFIPLYNLYLLAVLLFKKGTPGPNQYGQTSHDQN